MFAGKRTSPGKQSKKATVLRRVYNLRTREFEKGAPVAKNLLQLVSGLEFAVGPRLREITGDEIVDLLELGYEYLILEIEHGGRYSELAKKGSLISGKVAEEKTCRQFTLYLWPSNNLESPKEAIDNWLDLGDHSPVSWTPEKSPVEGQIKEHILGFLRLLERVPDERDRLFYFAQFFFDLSAAATPQLEKDLDSFLRTNPPYDAAKNRTITSAANSILTALNLAIPHPSGEDRCGIVADRAIVRLQSKKPTGGARDFRADELEEPIRLIQASSRRPIDAIIKERQQHEARATSTKRFFWP